MLTLAACAKQEPPATPATPAAQPPPASSVAAELARSSPPPPAPPGQDRASSAPAPNPVAAPNPGEELFTNTCATCHMADGGGVPNMQPSIIGSAWISNPDPQLLLSLILRGATVMGEAANAYDNKMPPLDHLTDAEIAAVASYVRTRFAASPIGKPVTPAEVAVARKRPGLPE